MCYYIPVKVGFRRPPQSEDVLRHPPAAYPIGDYSVHEDITINEGCSARFGGGPYRVSDHVGSFAQSRGFEPAMRRGIGTAGDLHPRIDIPGRGRFKLLWTIGAIFGFSLCANKPPSM